MPIRTLCVAPGSPLRHRPISDPSLQQQLWRQPPLWAILILISVLGPLGGIIGLYIDGALFRWTGSWFGGQATSEQVRAAFAWSSIPRIAALVLWLPLLGLYGAEMFTSDKPRAVSNLAPLLLGAALGAILDLWSLFLLIKTVAEAHRFSAWRALAALAIPTIVLFIVILGCAIAVFGLGGR